MASSGDGPGDVAFGVRLAAVAGGANAEVSSENALPASRRAAIVERTADIALSAMPVPLRILDVGCRAGELLHEMVARVPYGEAFVGVDDDPASLATARGAADPRMEFRLARPDALPFDAAGFDLVLAGAGVLSWPDPAAGVAELARVVSDAGRVVVAERARAGRAVRALIEQAGLQYENGETLVRAGFTVPFVRAFIAFP